MSVAGSWNVIKLSLLALATGTVMSAAAATEPAVWSGFQADAGHTGFGGTTAPAAYQPMWVARPDPPPSRGEATSAVSAGTLIISDLSPPTIAGCGGRAAIAEYAVVAYNATDGSQTWRTPVRGKLVGSPHVLGERVYAVVWTCPDRGNHAASSTVYAIDARDGHIVWQQAIPGTEAGPPVAADGLVLVPGRALRVLLAFDAETGKPRWQAPLRDDSPLTIEAPAVLGDTVFAVDARHLYAFDMLSGKKRWQRDADGKDTGWDRFYGSPVAADGLVMVVGHTRPPPPAASTAGRFSFEAFDAATGEFRSGLTLGNRDWSNVHWGVSYHAGKAFISGGWVDAAGKLQRGIIAFDVAASAEAWRVSLGDEVYPPAIDDAGHLLVTGTLNDAWLLDETSGAITWASHSTHTADTWPNADKNGNPRPGLPGRTEWLPDRWGSDIDGSPLLLDSIGHTGGLAPVFAGDLIFGRAGSNAPYLAAYGPDTTPPSARIRKPEGGYVSLGTEAVLGTAYDYNLKSWTLEYGAGESPAAWTLLGSDTHPRQGDSHLTDLLGRWQAAKLESGIWALRLTVTDTAGLTSAVTSQYKDDKTPPSVKIDWPVDGMTLDSVDFIVRGSADDDFEVKQVRVAVGGGRATQAIAGTTGWTSSYSASNRDAGEWIDIVATAEDMNGQSASANVRVRLAPLSVQLTDQGRRIVSNYPIFVPVTLGRDHDGLLDGWEEAAIQQTEAVFVLDEEETWLFHRSEEPVAQFARVRPYIPGPLSGGIYTETPIEPGRDLNAGLPPYVIFEFVVRWAMDYGRFGVEAHDIDTEKYFTAWKVVDPRTVELAYAYTSAHRSPNAHHAVWPARGQVCNVGDVANLWNEAEWEKEEYDHSEVLCGGLEFDGDGRLVLYPSEDKHAIYPSEAVCEGVSLVEVIGPNVGEDCGWQPSSNPLSDYSWSESDFLGDARYKGNGHWLLNVANAGDPPYILVAPGEILGLKVPLDALENGDENPPQLLRRFLAARYRIEIHTAGRNLWAGMTRIDLHLAGTSGAGDMTLYPVAHPPRGSLYAGNFLEGSTDVLYGIEGNLGDLEHLDLAVHAFAFGRSETWSVSSIVVTDLDTRRTWSFPGVGWMAGSPEGIVSSLTAGP